MSILFINACVRESSRTLVLAKHVMKDMSSQIVEVNLNLEHIEPLDKESLEKWCVDDYFDKFAKKMEE